MKVIAGLFGAYLIYMSFRMNGLVLSEDLLSLVIGVACIWYACKDTAEDGGSKKSRKEHSTIKSNVPGRSCLDCKHCISERADRKRGMIYCNWDSEYFFPETGHSCNDFNK